MKLPKVLRADMERALLHAYYRHVCGCDTISLDLDLFEGQPWVVAASRPGGFWMMDFSTHYEFPVEAKPSTVVRRMQERARAAVDTARRLARVAHVGPAPTPEVEYEVWCFMPASERVLNAVAATHSSGGQVTLVTPEALTERVRRAVLAVPDDGEGQAFVEAAAMIRRAFGLR